MYQNERLNFQRNGNSFKLKVLNSWTKVVFTIMCSNHLNRKLTLVTRNSHNLRFEIYSFSRNQRYSHKTEWLLYVIFLHHFSNNLFKRVFFIITLYLCFKIFKATSLNIALKNLESSFHTPENSCFRICSIFTLSPLLPILYNTNKNEFHFHC